jgi:multisubunit Na+/H+ antiporter MnhG subunit
VPAISRRAARRIALWVLASSAIVLVTSLGVLRLPPQETPVLAPVLLAIGGSALALLSLRARERAERGDSH